jgi:hypothetical protein
VSSGTPGPDESAERLVERVLADPAFRERVRHDPSQPAALETLELRESKSSMAGALMAAAVEGLALYEIVGGGGGLGADAAEAAVRPSAGDALSLVDNPRIQLDAAGVADLRAGRIDPRIVSVLEEVSRRHRITVSAMMSDHGVRTAGGSISNHHYGRAVDIAMIDGQAVSPGNAAARELAQSLLRLPAGIRPTELGSPWALGDPVAFTDGDHQNHIHVAFDDPPPPGWRPPAGLEPPAADGDDADAADGSSGDPDDSSGDRDDSLGVQDDSGDDQDDSGDPDDQDGSSDDDQDEDDDEDDEDSDEDDDEDSDEDDDDSDEDDDEDSDEDDDEDSDADGDDEDEPDEDEPDEVGPDFDDLTDDEYQGARAPAPDQAHGAAPPPEDAQLDLDGAPTDYPGDQAPPERMAAWMAAEAERRGLPGELPVMAALVESGMRNLPGGDADSVGFFQMRTSIWDRGEYAGYGARPELQLKWFLDHAAQLPSRGPERYGDWIADVERPAEQYRGRYQLRLDEARELLRGFRAPAAPSANQAQVLPVIRPDQVTWRPR